MYKTNPKFLILNFSKKWNNIFFSKSVNGSLFSKRLTQYFCNSFNLVFFNFKKSNFLNFYFFLGNLKISFALNELFLFFFYYFNFDKFNKTYIYMYFKHLYKFYKFVCLNFIKKTKLVHCNLYLFFWRFIIFLKTNRLNFLKKIFFASKRHKRFKSLFFFYKKKVGISFLKLEKFLNNFNNFFFLKNLTSLLFTIFNFNVFDLKIITTSILRYFFFFKTGQSRFLNFIYLLFKYCFSFLLFNKVKGIKLIFKGVLILGKRFFQKKLKKSFVLGTIQKLENNVFINTCNVFFITKQGKINFTCNIEYKKIGFFFNKFTLSLNLSNFLIFILNFKNFSLKRKKSIFLKKKSLSFFFKNLNIKHKNTIFLNKLFFFWKFFF